MATQTTYYNLIKPALSDPADIADINTNSDTIDSTLHSLNSQIDDFKVIDFGTVTLAQFQSALVTLGTSMGSKAYRHIYVAISTASDVFGNTAYIGTLETVSSTSRLIVRLREAYSPAPTDIEMNYKDGTWTTFSLPNALKTSTYNYTEWITSANNFLVTLSKIGTFVSMNLFFHTTTSGVAKNTTLGTIPAEYRPPSTVTVYAHNATTGNIFGASVGTDGVVVHTSNNSQNNITVVAMWNTSS